MPLYCKKVGSNIAWTYYWHKANKYFECNECYQKNVNKKNIHCYLNKTSISELEIPPDFESKSKVFLYEFEGENFWFRDLHVIQEDLLLSMNLKKKIAIFLHSLCHLMPSSHNIFLLICSNCLKIHSS